MSVCIRFIVCERCNNFPAPSENVIICIGKKKVVLTIKECSGEFRDRCFCSNGCKTGQD